MTIPRARRYPRQPITKAQTFTFNVRKMPTDAMIATALAARYGKRASHAYSESRRAQGATRKPDFDRGEVITTWTTNLTPTSPPLPPESTLDWRRASEWVQTAGEAQNAAYRPFPVCVTAADLIGLDFWRVVIDAEQGWRIEAVERTTTNTEAE